MLAAGIHPRGDACPAKVRLTDDGNPPGSANFSKFPTPATSVYGNRLAPSLRSAAITFFTDDWTQQPSEVYAAFASLVKQGKGVISIYETKLESGKVQCVYIQENKPNPGVQLEFKGPDAQNFKTDRGQWDTSDPSKRTCLGRDCTWTP